VDEAFSALEQLLVGSSSAPSGVPQHHFDEEGGEEEEEKTEAYEGNRDHGGEHKEDAADVTAEKLIDSRYPSTILLTLHYTTDLRLGLIRAWTALRVQRLQLLLVGHGYVLVYKVHDDRFWATLTFVHASQRRLLT
jgi:hypothetical protein